MKLSFDDPKQLAGQIGDLYMEDQSMKDGLLRVWEQNIHFINGQQTIEWDQYSRRFQHVPINNYRNRRSSIYVTNELEPIARVLVSFLTRNKPKTVCYPNDPSSDESVRRAKMAEMVLESKWEQDQEYESLVTCAYWLLTVGICFKKYYWDTSARGKIHLPYDQDMGPEALLNPMAPPPPQHWGDVRCAVLSPLQISVDFQATDLDNAAWVMESTLQKLDWVKEQYSQKGNGFTGLIEEVHPQDNFGRALELDLSMRFQTPMHKGAVPRKGENVVLHEFYQSPRNDMPWNKGNDRPRGRSIVCANGVILYDGPNKYPDWHPYTQGIYEPFLGRFWPKSLIEQLVSTQRRLNEINGTILENAQTMANPGWLVPEGAIDEGSLVGKNGSVTYWKPAKAQGYKPEPKPGIPLPPQYFNEKNMLLETMVRIAGSNAVMGGNPPTGVTAAAALQLLLENAQSQHGPLINNWETFIERSQTKKLRVFQAFCREPRRDLVIYAKRLNKNITSLDIAAICGDDIEDNVTIKVEAGSSIPKSQAMRQNQLMEFAKMGLINLQDPQNKQEFFSQFGITEFDVGQTADWEKIKWENGRMLKGEMPYPSIYDGHPLHKVSHIAETQKPSFIEDASDEVKNLYAQHIAWHEQQEQMMMAQQMQQQMMMARPQKEEKEEGDEGENEEIPENEMANPVPQPEAAPAAPLM